jgi:hypothetical protein
VGHRAGLNVVEKRNVLTSASHAGSVKYEERNVLQKQLFTASVEWKFCSISCALIVNTFIKSC